MVSEPAVVSEPAEPAVDAGAAAKPDNEVAAEPVNEADADPAKAATKPVQPLSAVRQTRAAAAAAAEGLGVKRTASMADPKAGPNKRRS